MTKGVFPRRVVGVALAALLAAACQTAGGGADPAGSRGEFGSEAGDPGLAGRGQSQSGSEGLSGGLRAVYFDFDRYDLRPDAKESLRVNARLLSQSASSRVEIQGNCDARGTEEYNLALGKRRAEAAKRYLMDLGVDPSRMSTISFGEENPAVRGSGEMVWAKNRRDDFVLR